MCQLYEENTALLFSEGIFRDKDAVTYCSVGILGDKTVA
jgi:hypothetical protein